MSFFFLRNFLCDDRVLVLFKPILVLASIILIFLSFLFMLVILGVLSNRLLFGFIIDLLLLSVNLYWCELGYFNVDDWRCGYNFFCLIFIENRLDGI
jgi:hypothetical protein